MNSKSQYSRYSISACRQVSNSLFVANAKLGRWNVKSLILSHGHVLSGEDEVLAEQYGGPVLVFHIYQGIFLYIGM